MPGADNKIDYRKIEDLIDKKILEAKLLVTEKRLQYFLVLGAALFAIFGLILPMYLTFQSTEKVDRAIEKFEQRFEELTGNQVLKPEIDCFVNGKALTNSTLLFNKQNINRSIQVRNEGNGVATFVRLRLYIDCRDIDLVRDFGSSNWSYADFNDKPGYKYMLEFDQTHDHIAPKDSFSFEFWINSSQNRTENIESPALLVVFYGAPEPKEFPFTFKIDSSQK